VRTYLPIVCTVVMLACSSSDKDTDTPSPSDQADTDTDTDSDTDTDTDSDTDTDTDSDTDTDTDTDTGDTGTMIDCEVAARDGATRSCTELVVFCDVSDANQDALDTCIECMGGVVDYYQYWQDTLATMDFYDTCSDVDLPPRAETCSPYTTGTPSSSAVLREQSKNGFAWFEGAIACNWTVELQGYGPSVPATIETEGDLAPHLSCFDVADNSAVAVPQAALDSFDLSANRVHLFDAVDTPWEGLYDTTLVFDQGCGGVGGYLPQVRVEALLIDRSIGVPDTVSCQLDACPAEVRDAPIPP